MESNKEADLFRITNTKVIGLLAAALIFVTSYIATNVINSPHSRIDKLAEQLEDLELKDRLTIMELTMGHIQDDDHECKSRQEALVKELAWVRETMTSYQSETKRRDNNQDLMITDCLDRTR